MSKIGWFLVNPFLLLLGIFIPTNKYPFYLKAFQLISRFTWELPQTVLGLLSGWFLLLSSKSNTLFFAHGVMVIKCKTRFGGFSLGCFIAGDREITTNYNDRLFQHEYGHYLQSMKSGWVYLFKYAIPSVISAWRNDYYGHAKHPVEQDANRRSFNYWHQNYQHSFSWDYKYNPLYNDVVPATLKWYDFLPVYFPIGHLVKALNK